MRKLARIIALATALLAASAVQAQVKNVIVFISDGWGQPHLDATAYWNGARQAYETDPTWTRYGMSNYSYVSSTDQPPYGDGSYQGVRGYDPLAAWSSWSYMQNYATDSAAAATAMSCGQKTYNAAIGYGVGGGSTSRELLMHAFELAAEKGKATGVVTSVTIPHATPAGFLAHDVSRNNYAAIALDMLASEADVVMGTGNPNYDDNGAYVPGNPATSSTWRYVGGYAAWQSLVAGTAGGAQPWHLMETKADFEALANGDVSYDRVWGCPQVRETLQFNRSGLTAPYAGNYNTTLPPYIDPQLPNVPSLETMTKGALNVLNRNPNGFCVMVEGGAVDWAAHARLLGRSIEEQNDFDAAVRATIAWVEANSNWNETVMIVTGDHETGYLWGDTVVPSDPSTWFAPVVNRGAGVMPGFLYYSAPGSDPFNPTVSAGHSNQVIPFFVRGVPGDYFLAYADEVDPVVGPYIDNTEVASFMFGLLNSIVANEPTDDEPVDESREELPLVATLRGNHPNPFNPTTNIEYALPKPGRVEIRVVDLGGRLVRTLSSAMMPAGTHSVQWDGTDGAGNRCASGTYCCQMVTDGRLETRKMMLVK